MILFLLFPASFQSFSAFTTIKIYNA